MAVPEIVCLLAYASLGLELLVFAVPSEVSTRRLWSTAQGSVAGRWLRLALPGALCIAVLVLPPVAILWPEVAAELGPIAWLHDPTVAWCGAVLVVAGRLLTLAAVAELRRSARQHRLATRGAFAWSRHPGLVGMFAFYLGCLLVVPCLIVLAGFAVYAAHMHGKVLLEEACLERAWGEDYRDYAARVARYLTV